MYQVPQALPVHLDQEDTKERGEEEDRKEGLETRGNKALWDRPERAASKALWSQREGEPGTKGVKGDIGPTGMPGTKGEPGESISSPAVVEEALIINSVKVDHDGNYICVATSARVSSLEWRSRVVTVKG